MFAAIASSLLCSALLALLVVPALTRTVETRLAASIDQLSSALTAQTGLVASYEAIILASGNGIRVEGLRFSAPAAERPAPRDLLSADSITAKVDLLAALAGKTERIVRRLRIEGLRLSLRLPDDAKFIDALAAPREGAAFVLPLLAAEIQSCALDLRLQDGTMISGTLPELGWSSLDPNPSFSLRESTLRLEPASGGPVLELLVDARGIASGDLSLISADMGLKVTVCGSDGAEKGGTIRLGRQDLQVRIGGGVIVVTRPGGDGLEIVTTYDADKAAIAGTARLREFRADSIVGFEGGAADLKSLAAIPLSGEISFGAGGTAAGGTTIDAGLRYRATLSAKGGKGLRIAGLPTEGASVSLSGEGDLKGLSALRLSSKLGAWSAGYEGPLGFADLALNGSIWARRGEDGTEAAIKGSGGRYQARAEKIRFGGEGFDAVTVSLQTAPGRTGITLAAAQAAPRSGAQAAGGSIQGTLVLGDAASEVAIDVSELRVAPLAAMVGALGLKGLPDLTAVRESIPDDLVASGAGSAVSDPQGTRWKADRIQARMMAGAEALVLRASVSGDLSRATIDSLDLRLGGTAVAARGAVRWAGEPGFEGSIDYAGRRYGLAATYADKLLRVTGSHGLVLEAGKDDGGAWKASLETSEFPLVLGNGILVAGMKASGRYAGAENWDLALTGFRLKYELPRDGSGKAAALPEISGDATLKPGELRFGRLDIRGEGYGLEGPATLKYAGSLADLNLELAATLKGAGFLGQGRAGYDLRASLADGALSAGIGFSSIPVAAGKGAKPLDASGYLRIRGPADLARILSGEIPDPESYRGDLSIALAGPGLQLQEQRLRLRYARGDLLAELESSGRLSGSARVRTADLSASVTLGMKGFRLADLGRLDSADPSLSALMAMSLTGSANLELGSGALRYSADLRADGAKSGSIGPVSTAGLSAWVVAAGDDRSLSSLDMEISKDGWIAGYRGSLGFEGFRVEGEARLRRSDAEARFPVSGALGRYAVSGGWARSGGTGFTDLSASLLAAKEGYDLAISGTLAAIVAAGTQPGNAPGNAPGSFSAEGHFGSATAGIGLEFSGLDPTLIRAFVAALDLPGIGALPGIPAGARLSGTLFAESDFKKVSWNALKLSGELPVSGAVLRFEGSGAGDLSEARIRSMKLSYAGNEASLSGILRYAGLPAFEGNVTYGGISYAMNARYEEGAVYLRGGHGLVAELRPDGRGGWDGSIEASELPVALAQGRAVASLRARGRFADPRDWNLGVERFSLRYEPAAALPAGALRLPELAGAFEFIPGTLRFTRLDLRGEGYGLGGPVTLAYAREGDNLVFDLQGDLASLENARERFSVTARLAGTALTGTLRFSGFPVERLPGMTVKGDLEGSIDFDGPFDIGKPDFAKLATLPNLKFTVALAQGEYRAMPLKAAASGILSGNQLRIHSLDFAWQGNTISDASAEVLIDQRRASLQASYKGAWGKERVNARLFVTVVMPASPGAVPGAGLDLASGVLPPLEFSGSFESVEIAETKLRDWGFSGTYSEEGIRFDGGGGQVQLRYANDGEFSLTLQDPFPVRVQALGSIRDTGIDAVLAGLNLDLAQIAFLMDTTPVAIRQGRLYGDLSVRGSLNDPELSGTAYILGGVIEINQLVRGTSEPFDLELLLSGRDIEVKPARIPIGGGVVDASATARLEALQLRDLTFFLKSRSKSTLDIDGTILGVGVEKGKGSIDLSLGISAERLDIGGKVLIEKGDVLINPGGFVPASAQAAATEKTPGPEIRVDAEFSFGTQVQAYLPSRDIPVISGAVDPASAVALRFDSASGVLHLDGKLQIKSGYFFFYLRNFFIKRAEVVFAETERKFDPLVTATAELREANQDGPVIIGLELADSPISNLRPRLSSVPAMSEAQLIALMGGGVLSTTSAEGTVGIREAVIASSEFLPQFNLYKSFENRVRQQLGLDVVYLRSTFLQRWLLDISSPAGESAPDDPLARYLDKSELYVGKYIGNAAFLHGSIKLREDPLVASSQLRLDSEIGIELDSPFGILSWSLSPTAGDGALVEGQKLSLSWRIPY